MPNSTMINTTQQSSTLTSTLTQTTSSSSIGSAATHHGNNDDTNTVLIGVLATYAIIHVGFWPIFFGLWLNIAWKRWPHLHQDGCWSLLTRFAVAFFAFFWPITAIWMYGPYKFLNYPGHTCCGYTQTDLEGAKSSCCGSWSWGKRKPDRTTNLTSYEGSVIDKCPELEMPMILKPLATHLHENKITTQ
ncbi:hypothetical protein BT63DRAFT_460246 [Microthyrium microscopicum]|uniref:Uncharacterized protein n=1 Tax=Microthyrium microscopicum TaxID=703497 RepID=A0A6A6U1D7_9PEZI|nr:hypothetical protein BT63DRAFT_460246 [Microthyrium microscopicum]